MYICRTGALLEDLEMYGFDLGISWELYEYWLVEFGEQQVERLELADAAPAIPIITITIIIGKNGTKLNILNTPRPKRKNVPKPRKTTNPITEPIAELFLDIFYFFYPFLLVLLIIMDADI